MTQRIITKTILNLLCVFCLSLSFAQAQSLQWARRLNQQTGNAVTVSNSGYLYTTGQFSGLQDFDPGSGVVYLEANGDVDVYVTKSDVAGNLIWARSIGGQGKDAGHAIDVDASGNVYVTGEFTFTALFNPGVTPSVMHSSNSNSIDIFVAKYDASGNLLWAHPLGSQLEDMPNTLQATPQGDVVIGGYFNATLDFDPGANTVNRSTHSGSTDAFFLKLSAAGNFVWVKVIGGESYDACESIDIDTAGNIYMAGRFSNITDFDPDAGFSPFISPGGTQAFYAKYNALGAYVWANAVGGKLDDGSSSIHVDVAGNVYTTGYFTDTADFNPTTSTYNLISVGNKDAFITKSSSAGVFQWAVSLGGSNLDQGTGIGTDDSGYVYVSGAYRFTVDFDPGNGTFNQTAGGSNPDIFILRLTNAGGFNWAGTMGGAAADAANGFYVTPGAEMYFTGYVQDTADLDPTSGIYKIFPAGGFVSRFAMCNKPVMNGGINGPTSVCELTPLAFNIASATGAASYSWTLPVGWSGTSSTNTINVMAGTSGGVVKVSGVNSCGLSTPVTLNVTVNPNPVVTLNLSAIDTQCVNVSSVTLTGGLPAGGVYSGTAVSSGSFSPSTAGVGSFAIQYRLTTGAGCADSASANIVVDVCAGIEPPDEPFWGVYPNPSSSHVTLSVSGNNTRMFEMYNLMGVQVGCWLLGPGAHVLDLSVLPKGVYLVRSVNGDAITTLKLVRE